MLLAHDLGRRRGRFVLSFSPVRHLQLTQKWARSSAIPVECKWPVGANMGIRIRWIRRGCRRRLIRVRRWSLLVIAARVGRGSRETQVGVTGRRHWGCILRIELIIAKFILVWFMSRVHMSWSLSTQFVPPCYGTTEVSCNSLLRLPARFNSQVQSQWRQRINRHSSISGLPSLSTHTVHFSNTMFPMFCFPGVPFSYFTISPRVPHLVVDVVHEFTVQWESNHLLVALPISLSSSVGC